MLLYNMRHALHVVGARPNFMKAAPVHSALARRGCRQTVIHTGQHYDAAMSEVFFRQLSLPQPDKNLEIGSGSHGAQTAQVMLRLEPLLADLRPDWVLVYGDVNSTAAAALTAVKLGLRTAHVESGLRSRDRGMPEEHNRVVTDHLCDLLFTPSEDADRNLRSEGIAAERIRRVGNVMIDTLVRLLPQALEMTPACMPVGKQPFILVTLHRPSNVDDRDSLIPILQCLDDLAEEVAVVFPMHPRTRACLNGFKPRRLTLAEPLGYIEFLAMQSRAALVVTDSGGIQEETTFLKIPCLTVRDNTERPVTVEVGTNRLVGSNPERLGAEARKILSGRAKKGGIPPLWDGKAGDRLADALLASG